MPDLCSVADVKASLELTTDDHDALIADLIMAASAVIPQRYQRELIGETGGTRTFAVRERLVDLAPYDLRAGATVTLHPEEGGQALTADQDYVLLPEGGARLGGSYQRLRLSSRLVLDSTLAQEFGHARLQIAGDWGCYAGTATLDESLRRGAVLTVSSWMDRAVAEYAMAADEGRALRPDNFGSYAIPAAAHSIFLPWARIGTP